MESLKQSLTDIVNTYTQYDSTHKTYQPISFSLAQLQKIELQLITLFAQFLTSQGVEDQQITQQHRLLRKPFHPDKLAFATAEIQWLEYSLSNGSNNGACFKLIDNCAAELKQPKLNIDDFIFEQNNQNSWQIDELIRQLKQQRELAVTLTQQVLIDSTLNLLHCIKSFQSTTDKLDAKWLQKVLRTLPYITSGFCIGLYLKELSLLYAILFIIAKCGNGLTKGDVRGLRELGVMAREFSNVISSTATTLMLYFISINFAVMNTAYYIGFSACAKVYQLISFEKMQQSASDNFKLPALTLSPQDFLPGKFAFTTLELKLVALKLEQYQEQQKLQYFSSWRRGCRKAQLIEETLQRIKLIDLKPIAVFEKIKEAKLIINGLTYHRYFSENNSKAKETLQAVKSILQSLIDNYHAANDAETENNSAKLANLLTLT